MQTKIKNLFLHMRWDYFKDVRFLALLAFGGLMLLTAWSSLRILETNYRLQQDIARLAQENQVAQLENENLNLSNAFYETDTYLELAARKHYNKGKPGEKLILVPEPVAMQRAASLAPMVDKSAQEPQELSGYRKNFSDWMKFLFQAG